MWVCCCARLVPPAPSPLSTPCSSCTRTVLWVVGESARGAGGTRNERLETGSKNVHVFACTRAGVRPSPSSSCRLSLVSVLTRLDGAASTRKDGSRSVDCAGTGLLRFAHSCTQEEVVSGTKYSAIIVCHVVLRACTWVAVCWGMEGLSFHRRVQSSYRCTLDNGSMGIYWNQRLV